MAIAQDGDQDAQQPPADPEVAVSAGGPEPEADFESGLAAGDTTADAGDYGALDPGELAGSVKPGALGGSASPASVGDDMGDAEPSRPTADDPTPSDGGTPQ